METDSYVGMVMISGQIPLTCFRGLIKVAKQEGLLKKATREPNISAALRRVVEVGLEAALSANEEQSDDEQ